MLPPLASGAGGFLLGAIIGSFLATLILRWPQERSVATGRSACDHCGRTLGPLELVPILGHLMLRGKCRSCHGRIDRFHLWVELFAALIGGVSLYLLPGVTGLVVAVMGWLLVPLVLLDWRHLWLPDRLTLLLGAIGLLVAGLANGLSLMDRAIGGLVGFASLWSIASLYRKLRLREGMGAGDPKLFGALGCWVGWAALPPLLLVAAAGLLAILIVSGRAQNDQSQHPFGSALGIAGFVIMAWQAAAIA
ncbi:prepilin peptidase [Sphingomicrobium flavum]|uniref:prepilin peptidase n=1 Tax=Sphingomicrobium flavum TaxID=1229164 RepID=UPI0021AD9C0B|nr:A24 family peptidase [Sphingomicrobium flavum]